MSQIIILYQFFSEKALQILQPNQKSWVRYPFEYIKGLDILSTPPELFIRNEEFPLNGTVIITFEFNETHTRGLIKFSNLDFYQWTTLTSYSGGVAIGAKYFGITADSGSLSDTQGVIGDYRILASDKNLYNNVIADGHNQFTLWFENLTATPISSGIVIDDQLSSFVFHDSSGINGSYNFNGVLFTSLSFVNSTPKVLSISTDFYKRFSKDYNTNL